MPLGGGSSAVRTVGQKSEFRAGGSDGPLWIAGYSTDLRGGNEKAAGKIASEALKQLKKSGLFP